MAKISIDSSFLWLILLTFGQASNVSYNQPKLDPNATWSVNASLFASSSTVGSYPRGLFINSNNSIYILIIITAALNFFI
ncbi:hypothetical protein I4U23_004058 [Adineta vaga]|nr:hypothetical protein I4U23_004058 [Adineta vaga]